MALLKDKIKTLYFKYLFAAFGSAMITSIYSMVDMAMVGKYHGAEGTAALAVVAPIWNVIYSLGLFTGIGGSVLFNVVRGKSLNGESNENEYFTVSFFGSILFACAAWFFVFTFETPILQFFGADETLLVMAKEYLRPIQYVFPLFLLNQMLAAFLRSDNNPNLATVGVLCGGIFNMIGDYLFVFSFDMGILGAGLATAIGSCISFFVMTFHFFTKKNTLALRKPAHPLSKLKKILITGFPSFFIDIAMGILTVLFNRQIMKYLGSNALAVYGIIINISTFVQCCGYSVGQASQPIISMNYGAGKGSRIKETLKYALFSSAFFSVFWTALSLGFPNLYVYLFMNPTDEILKIAPYIIGCYSISFLLLPFNIFSTYYFQALLKPTAAFLVSVIRGLLLSGVLILLIPILFGAEYIWFAMPVTELSVALYAVCKMRFYTKSL